MELFNSKFVYFMWDDKLKGKDVFFDDDINELISEVNNDKLDIYRKTCECKSIKHSHPFQMNFDDENDCYRFVYYDPNYDVKVAYNKGEIIQFKDANSDYEWKDCTNAEFFFDDSRFEFRIKPNKKWWIMPKYTPFDNNDDYQQFGSCYYVTEQEDIYSKNCPPLKSNFDSKEEAEEWLKNYLKNKEMFEPAINDINNLVCNLGHVVEKLQRQEMISEIDWKNCFELFNQSKEMGALKKVTK